MAASNIASTGIVLEVLTRDNYLDWSALVKNYLIGKKLWDNIVVGNVDPRKPNWKSKNGQALHAIQLSCGHYTLRQIRNCETAQEAWNHLKAVFSEDLRADKSNNDIEQGGLQSDIDKFHVAVKKGMWNDAILFIRNDGDIISQKSSANGWTSLHVAVDAGRDKITKELVKMGALLTEKDWEGYTPFALAAKLTDDTEMVKWMLDKGGNDLLTMKIKADDGKGDIPVLLAAAKGHKEVTRFLFSKTRWFTLLDNDYYYGAKLLSHCIHAEIFDVAAALIQHDGTKIPLSYESDQCTRPIYGLAHIPTVFHSGTKLNWCEQFFYNVLWIPPYIDLERKRITIESRDEGSCTYTFPGGEISCRLLDTFVAKILRLAKSLAGAATRVTKDFPKKKAAKYIMSCFGRSAGKFQIIDIKKIYEIKKNCYLVREIMRCLCEKIEKISSESELHQCSIHDAMLQAAKYGIIEFINSMRKANPDLLWAMDKNKRVAGKTKLKLKVRVIHLWAVPEYTRPEEDNFIHMLLLDEKNGKIQATAKKSLIPKVKTLVQEGATYEVENVLVARNDPKFATTPHKFKINLMDCTSWTKLDENVIPFNHFDFMPFKDVLGSDNEGRYVDVIGHVCEKDDLKEKEAKGKTSKLIDLTLEDPDGNRIHCFLWGAYAEKIHSYLSNNNQSSPAIVVLQLCKLKKYFGTMGVCNAFYGTRLILDNEEPAVAEYRKRIEGVDIQVTQGVSQASTTLSVPLPDDLLQTPKMSIEYLIEATELCHGVVLATICGIESEYSWYYEACTKCAGRVNIIAGRMYCPKCKQGRNAVPRYKVHLQAIDPTGSTSFILFDRNVQNYVGRSVHDLIERRSQGNNNTDYPRELDVFLGKTMLFKVEVTQGNLLHSWRNYSVKRSSDDIDLIKRFKILHNIKDEDADIDDNAMGL